MCYMWNRRGAPMIDFQDLKFGKMAIYNPFGAHVE